MFSYKRLPGRTQLASHTLLDNDTGSGFITSTPKLPFSLLPRSVLTRCPCRYVSSQHTSHHVPKSTDTRRSGVIFVTSRLCGVTLVVGKSYLIPPSWLQLCAAYAARSQHLLTCALRSFYLFIPLLNATSPPPSIEWLLLKAAVALGFHAMLRFGAFCQLTPSSLTVVLNDGDEWPLLQIPASLFLALSDRLLGFRFTFTPKYTSSEGRVTSAFFCHICDVAPNLQAHCPVCAILRLREANLFRYPTRPIFDPKILTPTSLSSYLALFAGRSRSKSSEVFKPH